MNRSRRAAASERTILVVDDDPMMRLFLAHCIGPHYAVAETCDGLEALAWLGNGHRADLAIIDLDMPGLDGLSLIERLRAAERLSALPVLMLSASENEAHRAAGERLGVRDFLVKPFDPDVLLYRIERILREA